MERRSMHKVAYYVYDAVEVLDFAGPLSVFSTANKISGENLFSYFSFSDGKKEVITQNGIKICADYEFKDIPAFDILLIAGGKGSRTEVNNKKIIDLIKETAKNKKLILSVCTGALLLAEAGVFKNKTVPTHRAAEMELRAIDKTIKLTQEPYVYDEEMQYIQTAGVLSGIKGALFFVREKYGVPLAADISKHLYL